MAKTTSKKTLKKQSESKKTSVKKTVLASKKPAKKQTSAVSKKTSKKIVTPVSTEEFIIKERTIVKEQGEEQDNLIKTKLQALYALQTIDTRINRIRIIRGELPLEVQELEDEVVGLQTRIQNIEVDIEEIKNKNTRHKLFIKDCLALIQKYEEQLSNVKNNREFESLNKEMQYQKLEIEYNEKLINDNAKLVEEKKTLIENTKEVLNIRLKDLEEKKIELNEIISETEIDEKKLLVLREKRKIKIDANLIYSYNKLRLNARNGLAVVNIERNACGGCFSKIPTQRQLEIKQHKKIIVCEYCGRILIDDSIVEAVKID